MMQYSKAKIENGHVVVTESRVIDQRKLTADCWMFQFEGLKACANCEYQGTELCGAGRGQNDYT